MATDDKWATVTGALAKLVAELPHTSRISLRYMGVVPTKPPPTSCTKDDDCGEYGPCLAVFNMCTGGVGGSADSCDPADYLVPEIPLTDQLAAVPAIQSSLQAHKADGGGSPVFAALFGTLQSAVESQKARREASTRVLFATDGGDATGCKKQSPPEIAGVAKVAWDSGRVRTFIAGVSASGDTPTQLGPVAVAGESKKVRVLPPGSTVEQVADAMRAVVPRCTFALPPGSGYTLARKSAGGQVALPLVGALAACSGDGYWLDDPQSPAKIELCPKSCDALVGPADQVVVKAACP
ncbi:MAG: hypothetical protein IT374_26730 [Polyangiaceae bacterium]|nr:hypothetical protein [Polyangiaceae bacterium]